jgi:hypothetical protein
MGIYCAIFVTMLKLQHLFFNCALAKFLWRVIQLMFGLSVPRNVKHVYGDWIQNMNNTNKRLLFVILGAMFWSIWLSWNDIVFNKKAISSYMQVMFRASFQKEEGQVILRSACRLMETMTMEIFTKYGW